MADRKATGRVIPLDRDAESLAAENQKLKEALKESEDRYNRMLDNLKEEFLFYRHDTSGKFTYISPSYANILGFGPDEYIGMEATELWTPNPINEAADRATKLSCQGIRQPPYEMEIYHKSGALRRFVTIETPIFDDQGQVIAVEGTARDITEKRKIEEQLDKYRMTLEDLVQQRTAELQTSRKQLADIIDFLPDPIYVVDTEEKIIAWNRAMVDISGVPKESVLGHPYRIYLSEFYRSSDPTLVQLALEGFSEEKVQNKNEEKPVLAQYGIKSHGDVFIAERFIPSLHGGEGGYVLITAGPILDNEKRIIGAIESLRDVTQIKLAERQIRQSERRLSTLMSNLPGMAYRIIIEKGHWHVAFASEGCWQIFGREPAFFIGRNLAELKSLIHAEDLNRLMDIAGSAVSEMKTFECEYRILTASGETKWVFDKAEVVAVQDGNRLSVEGFMADFTVFKQMEEKLRNENILLRSAIRDRYKFKNIIGNCQAMQEVFDLIVKAATTQDNVFIFGESGTGKELVAKAIHDSSDRKNKGFVAVNCAAIPENLIESEFFGTSKGAYTGANADKQGYLEAADGGTLFLDEIGDISPNLQVKLLRAIDGGGFSPVGSRRVIQPNLRIIAASNKDLQQLVGGGRIRQDFFFRIHVIPIHLPSLRERGDDIYMLINHYLKSYSPNDSITSLTREELETLKNHHWPGNVRELQNVLRRYITMKNLHFMELPGIEPGSDNPVHEEIIPSESKDLRETMIHIEKKMILKVLEQTRWNKTRAAKELGVSRKTLFRKMKACGLK